jgi:hypothetical protein
MPIQSDLLSAASPAGTERGVLVRPIGTGTVSGTVTANPATGTLTDRSGTITAGGTAQQLAAANTSRKYFFVQNLSAENMWVNFTTTAVASQPSIRLTPGSSFTLEGGFVSTEAVHVIAATTGSAWSAKEGS